MLLVMEDDESTDSEVYKVHCRSFLKKEWKKYAPKKEAVMISNHFKHYGPFQDDFLQWLKSRIAQALFDMGVKHPVQDKDVQLGYKPNKSVIALKSFGVNQLVLVPVTKISATVKGSPCRKATCLWFGKPGYKPLLPKSFLQLEHHRLCFPRMMVMVKLRVSLSLLVPDVWMILTKSTWKYTASWSIIAMQQEI